MFLCHDFKNQSMEHTDGKILCKTQQLDIYKLVGDEEIT